MLEVDGGWSGSGGYRSTIGEPSEASTRTEIDILTLKRCSSSMFIQANPSSLSSRAPSLPCPSSETGSHVITFQQSSHDERTRTILKASESSRSLCCRLVLRRT